MTTPTDTRITLSRVMSQAEANLLGNVHGGNIMKMVDDTAGVSANRFAQGPAVTAAILANGTGAVVYARKTPDPSPRWFGFHEIFHVCTVAAWACQCVACFLAVLR